MIISMIHRCSFKQFFTIINRLERRINTSSRSVFDVSQENLAKSFPLLGANSRRLVKIVEKKMSESRRGTRMYIDNLFLRSQ